MYIQAIQLLESFYSYVSKWVCILDDELLISNVVFLFELVGVFEKLFRLEMLYKEFLWSLLTRLPGLIPLDLF